MSNFSFVQDHEDRTTFVGGPCMHPALAAGLQALYDQMYEVWVSENKPALPLCAGHANPEEHLPELAQWLFQVAPAAADWFAEQGAASTMDYGWAFWQNAAVITAALNAMWQFA